MPRYLSIVRTMLVLGISISPAVVSAQSVAAGLSSLLTDETPPPQGYVRDRAAADATFATVAGLFQVELSGLPVASSAGGFAYRFSPGLGTVERASDTFGPFFSERAVRSGRRHLSLGLSYGHAEFDTLQGADLTSGTFPTNTARFADQLQPFSVDTLTLTLERETVTAVANYGLTDRLDVGVVVPVVRLRYSGRRVNTFNGQSTLQSARAGTATGLGDVTLNARMRVAGTGASGAAVGTDVRFATGREEDLLGAGKNAWRLMGIGSWERGLLALNANAGFGLGGVSREQFWSGGVGVAAGLRVTLIGELLGRRLSGLYRVSDVYQPHPVVAGVETMRWLPEEAGVTTHYLVTGAKWNVGGSWLLNASLLTRLTDTGLKARFTPTLALDYGLGF